MCFVAALTLSLVACSGDDERPSAEVSASHESPSDTFDASGILILYIPLMSDSIASNQDFCDRNMGLSEGDQVLIKDAGEAVVGFGRLSRPMFKARQGWCEMAWTAVDVPASRGVFALQVGDYSPTYFKQSEAERGLQTRLPEISVE